MPTISYITEGTKPVPVMDYWWPNLLDAQRFLKRLKTVYPDKYNSYCAGRLHFDQMIRYHRQHGVLIEDFATTPHRDSKILVCYLGGKIRVSCDLDTRLFVAAHWFKILRPYQYQW